MSEIAWLGPRTVHVHGSRVAERDHVKLPVRRQITHALDEQLRRQFPGLESAARVRGCVQLDLRSADVDDEHLHGGEEVQTAGRTAGAQNAVAFSVTRWPTAVVRGFPN